MSGSLKADASLVSSPVTAATCPVAAASPARRRKRTEGVVAGIFGLSQAVEEEEVVTNVSRKGIGGRGRRGRRGKKVVSLLFRWEEQDKRERAKLQNLDPALTACCTAPMATLFTLADYLPSVFHTLRP
ncbi:hypothetical protein MLD38_037997 [Melastoma candidum]|uniref:Uncharacterized protein n=1 Tax=Melastoma candidum TaxID=119954 RepID=A0ACB9KYN7_9MYRT|nr:hypothetical protein MLD38_037997 [Melastoma candidum]